MATLLLLPGQSPGRQFSCDGDATIIGRQHDCSVCLDDPAVSRKHARIVKNGKDNFSIEDLGSSNGTYVNGTRIERKQQLREGDTLQIGPYVLSLRLTPTAPVDIDPIIRSQVPANSSNSSLFAQNAALKLQVVVEIAQSLGRTLEVQSLLDKLMEQLFRLFSQAERAMVILCEGEQFVVRAQRSRHRKPTDIAAGHAESDHFPFSRSLVRRALEDGAGLLSEDVNDDANVPKTATLMALNLRSFLCVPLIGSDQRRLGVIQVDCLRPGLFFRHEDLELLTAISLHVASVLENAALHEERLKEEKLRQELAVARNIQQSFLPAEFRPIEGGYELFACCRPAREVSGDLYDFFPTADGKLALFIGDVTGKGMPAALMMVAVRTLVRHLAGSNLSPGPMLQALNNALYANNPTTLFVTMSHALFDPQSGELILASGGHPPPILRTAGGKTEQINLRSLMMLGYDTFERPPPETKLMLNRGDLLIFYTDGLTEPFTPNREQMFGVERLREVFAGKTGELPLPEAADALCKAVSDFTRQPEQQDDQTLLLLRRT